MTDQKRRHQSQTERDLEGIAARKERQSQPLRAVPEPVEDDLTDKYEGAELAEKRAKRDTHERIARLEVKSDEDRKADAERDKFAANMDGKLDTLLELVKKQNDNEHRTSRLRISTRGKVVIGVVGAVCTAAATVAVAALTGCI